MLSDTTSACRWHKQGPLVVGVAPKDYISTVSRLPTEVIYWIDSKTFVKLGYLDYFCYTNAHSLPESEE